MRVIPKRNTTKSEEIKNGAKGSSDRILIGLFENLLNNREHTISRIPIMAPAQKAINIAAKFCENGKKIGRAHV